MDSTSAASSSSPAANSSRHVPDGGSVAPVRATTAARLARRVVRGVLTFIFAVAGLFLGAVTGALIGIATESGVFRGCGIGAITGALVSIEVVDRTLALWRSRQSGIWSVLYVINVIFSLLSGRLVREKVDPAVQSAVRSQMNAIDAPFRETLDLFEMEGTVGMARSSIDRLPEVKLTEDDADLNVAGDGSGCSVCLQDFEIGEKVRRLPGCLHTFHVPCIDGWLVKHGTCPLCRRNL